MKARTLKIEDQEDFLYDLFDEELTACSGGLVRADILTSQKLLSVSPTTTSEVDIHAGPKGIDGPTNVETEILSFDTTPSVRCRTKAG
ncbi:MAG TPA: hypothetical protein V6D12_03725 [Candidatus Obscuribacterales bacterium]